MLADELYRRSRSELCRKIEEWVASPEPNLRWFAAEVIGYFRIAEFKNKIKLPEHLNPDNSLESWELNCVWACSRFEPHYESLQNLLITTTSARNQRWILQAYNQMIESNEIDLHVVASYLDAFAAKKHSPNINNLTQRIASKARLAQPASGVS
jgi:hypothetical protein